MFYIINVGLKLFNILTDTKIQTPIEKKRLLILKEAVQNKNKKQYK